MLGLPILHVHYRNVALEIVHSNQWKAALRHSDDQKTPFRRMIALMPCKHARLGILRVHVEHVYVAI